MKTIKARAVWAISAVSLLVGCASPPQFRARPDLLHDSWFSYGAGQERQIIAPDEVLAFSAETASDLDAALLRTRNASQRVDLLVDTIYGPQRREFDYRSAVTTPTEQTFRQHAGNCLALALMSLALADKFGLDAQLQEVPMVPVWERQGQFDLISGQGRDGEAALYAQRIARMRDNDPYYHYMIGAEKFAQGDLRGAIGSFEHATSLGIGFVEIHEALRDAYRATGDIERARMEKKRLMELARARQAGNAIPSPGR